MTEPIRIYCDDPEYTDAWIDIQARVTQAGLDAAEEKAKSEKKNDKWWLVRHLATACHIPTDSEPITDPQNITDVGLRDVDVFLVGWLENAVPLAISKRRVLGNACARSSLPMRETK